MQGATLPFDPIRISNGYEVNATRRNGHVWCVQVMNSPNRSLPSNLKAANSAKFRHLVPIKLSAANLVGYRK